MGMQTDVKQAHLNGSGFLVKSPVRVKGVSFYGAGSADGILVLFDTAATPVSASVTYARSGTTVTVTKTAHGLITGAVIGIHFATGTGGTATDGTYTITRVDADTFTLTDINTGTITGTPAAVYAVGRWLLTYESDSTDVFQNAPLIPGEGVKAQTGVYAYTSNIAAAQIYYG
jgi:hypothetical protein